MRSKHREKVWGLSFHFFTPHTKESSNRNQKAIHWIRSVRYRIQGWDDRHGRQGWMTRCTWYLLKKHKRGPSVSEKRIKVGLWAPQGGRRLAGGRYCVRAFQPRQQCAAAFLAPGHLKEPDLSSKYKEYPFGGRKSTNSQWSNGWWWSQTWTCFLATNFFHLFPFEKSVKGQLTLRHQESGEVQGEVAVKYKRHNQLQSVWFGF